MALVSRPLEQRWSERTRSEAQGRMQGCAFFFLLFFAQTKKSKAPCKAQPVVPSRGKRHEPTQPSMPVTFAGKLQEPVRSRQTRASPAIQSRNATNPADSTLRSRSEEHTSGLQS